MDQILRDAIGELAREHDSFYLYDERSVLEQIRRLRKHFPKIDFLSRPGRKPPQWRRRHSFPAPGCGSGRKAGCGGEGHPPRGKG